MVEGIGLLGSGGHANEVEAYSRYPILFRAVNKQYLGGEANVDIQSPSPELVETPVHVAVGSPLLRELFSRQWPGKNFTSVISERAWVAKSAEISEGCLLAPNAVVTTDVLLGRHAIVNVGASVQHNSRVGDFVTIGPGVRIGGNVTIEDGAFIGIGASIKNGVSLAEGVVLGAGSTLLSDAEIKNGVYVGSPAKCVKVNEEWLREI